MKTTKILAAICGLTLMAHGEAQNKEGQKETEIEVKAMPSFSQASICLKDATPPEQEKVEKAIRDSFELGEDDKFEAKVAKNERDDGYQITVSFDGENSITARSMGASVPWADLESASANSFYWQEGAKILKPSKDHLVVTAVTDAKEPKKRALYLGRSVAAIANATDALGIYYSKGKTVHEPETFSKMISEKMEKAGDVPALVWVGFSNKNHEDGTNSFYTRGLTEFGCKELEVVKSKKPPSEIFQLLLGVSQYLIGAGDVIKDGDILGGGGDHKTTVHLVDSALDRDNKVLRIDF